MIKHLPLHYDAWSYFVGDDVEFLPYTGNQESPINSIQRSIYVFDATFIHLGQEGSIYISAPKTVYILVSQSFFFSSHSTHEGGSIYANGCNLIQYRVCSINSTISNVYGCHSCDEYTNKSYAIQSSISQSSGTEVTIGLGGENQLIDSSNISHSKCSYNSAFSCYNENILFHRVNFTSIYNNTSDGSVMSFSGGNQCIDHCNVFNNKGTTVSNLCIQLKLKFCIFYKNSGPSLFDNGNGKIVVQNCLIYKNKVIQISSGDSVEINTIDLLYLNLHHLSTQECIDFPLLFHINTPDSDVLNFLFSFLSSMLLLIKHYFF